MLIIKHTLFSITPMCLHYKHIISFLLIKVPCSIVYFLVGLIVICNTYTILYVASIFTNKLYTWNAYIYFVSNISNQLVRERLKKSLEVKSTRISNWYVLFHNIYIKYMWITDFTISVSPWQRSHDKTL